VSLLVKALHNARSNDGPEKESGENDTGEVILHDTASLAQSENAAENEEKGDIQDGAETAASQTQDAESTNPSEIVETIEKERSVTGEYIERLSLEISELEEDARAEPECISANIAAEIEEENVSTATESAGVVTENTTAQSPELAELADSQEQAPEGQIGTATDTLQAFIREREKARKQKLLVSGAVVLFVLALPVFFIDLSSPALFLQDSTAFGAGAQQMDDAAGDEPVTNTGAGYPGETSAATIQSDPNSAAAGFSVNDAGETAIDTILPADDAVANVSGAIHQNGITGNAGEGYSPIVISKRRVKPMLTQNLNKAYQYFQEQNHEAARKYYQLALEESPGSTSALNGLGAIALESGDKSLAEKYFYAALKSDPNSAYAKAALLNLGRDRGSPRQEELLISAVRKNSGDAVAAHVLGQFYAARKEWSKAQGYLFSAFSIDSANADYAFNLAVSLDHLKQAAAAREYYAKALQLAAASPTNFSRAAVEQRLMSLNQQIKNTIQNPS